VSDVLADVLADDLRLVVCGSAAGRRSAELRQYYAGPGNRFWRTLHEVGLTPRVLAPAEFASLTQFGIGLTDLVKRQSRADAGLVFGRADETGLRAKIVRHRPRIVCFNGKRSAQEFLGGAVAYGLQPSRRAPRSPCCASACPAPSSSSTTTTTRSRSRSRRPRSSRTPSSRSRSTRAG
jgi:double-stranded uracil-DNA glycosylase